MLINSMEPLSAKELADSPVLQLGSIVNAPASLVFNSRLLSTMLGARWKEKHITGTARASYKNLTAGQDGNTLMQSSSLVQELRTRSSI